MKCLRQLCGATCLILTFTVSTWSGQMGTPYTPPPPPPSTSASTSDLALVDPLTAGTTSTIDEQIVEVEMGILQAFLSVL